MDFTADGRYLLASCEFSGQMVVVDVAEERVVRTIDLPGGRSDMPQDVKLSPDGSIFYVADMHANGVWEINAHTFRVIALPRDRRRCARPLPEPGRQAASTSRTARRLDLGDQLPHPPGRREVADPGGGSPDMGGVSADGKVLWLSGRYNAEVYAISTRNGRLLARIPVGQARTACASGRSPAATRSATPASCADPAASRPGRRRALGVVTTEV